MPSTHTSAAVSPPNFKGYAELPQRNRDFVFDSRSGSLVPASSVAALLRRDAGSCFDRCIVAAEVHDNRFTHSAQLAVIDGARRLPDARPLVVGLESFYRAHNTALDAYVYGAIDLNDLLNLTAWNNVWGFEAELYRPIFEYCRLYRIPMRGLNVPRAVSHKVAQVGLQGLPPEYLSFIPDSMDLANMDHYNHFIELMTAYQGIHSPGAQKLQRYYEVQVLWDEFMSQSVELALKQFEDARMVALIGSGHVEFRNGFPDRIQRRCQERAYTIVPRPVLWTNNGGYSMPAIQGPEVGVADLVWYTREA